MIVEFYVNSQVIELSGSDVIAFTKSVFDINRLNVRTSTYSNVFKVPKTQQNRLVFKSAGIVNSFNDEPYDQLTVTITVDGVEVINGIAQLVASDGDFYSVSVQSGNGNFFKSIKSISLTDLESYLTPLDHNYDATEVNARRDLSSGLVYPNVDYGWFQRATLEDQPFNFFYPALYVKHIIDSAIDSLTYRQTGSFWTGATYGNLAIMAKGIVSDADSFFIQYAINSGTDFFITRDTNTLPDSYEVISPLNFPEEISDTDALYVDTDLGLGYTTFGYNFPTTFGVDTTFQVNLNGSATINNIVPSLRDNYIEEAKLVFRLEIWNKTTDTFVNNSIEVEYSFYTASYGDVGGVTTLTPGSETFIPTFDISEGINDPSNLAAIGATATDHALVWFIEVETTTSTLEPVSTYDSLDQVSVTLEFDIQQTSGGSPTTMSVINSFDDINVGELFLYVCNVAGVFPLVDEGMKTIQMVSFDDIRRNKINAIDWSKKIDLSDDPQVSFRLNYARSNLFSYNNDEKDVWLKELTNYGQGALNVDDENVEQETTKYTSPFSLCAIGATFDNARSMAKIFTGDKYVFNGVDYDLNDEALVEGFTTRIVNLSRVTDALVQITSVTPVTGNYEVNNATILFSNVLRNRYSLINGILDKTKVVRCLMRLTPVDFEQFDFTKPVFVDYFNDYFLVNEIGQFKINEVDSTMVTLIRL